MIEASFGRSPTQTNPGVLIGGTGIRSHDANCKPETGMTIEIKLIFLTQTRPRPGDFGRLWVGKTPSAAGLPFMVSPSTERCPHRKGTPLVASPQAATCQVIGVSCYILTSQPSSSRPHQLASADHLSLCPLGQSTTGRLDDITSQHQIPGHHGGHHGENA